MFFLYKYLIYAVFIYNEESRKGTSKLLTDGVNVRIHKRNDQNCLVKNASLTIFFGELVQVVR